MLFYILILFLNTLTPDEHPHDPYKEKMHYFAKYFVGDYSAKKHTAKNMADAGGADLYMIQAPGQKFVIKFERVDKIEKEAQALYSLQECQATPKLMGSAFFKNEDSQDTVGVLIESFVQGDTLHTFFEKVAKAKNPASLWVQMLYLKKAIKNIAKEIQSFHSLKIQPVHNDLHPGNIIYNSDTDTSTLIDHEYTTFCKQDREEDIAYFLLTFEMYASKCNLHPNLVQKLQSVFLKNYALALNQELLASYRKLHVQEFKEHFDEKGSSEEKVLLAYLHKL